MNARHSFLENHAEHISVAAFAIAIGAIAVGQLNLAIALLTGGVLVTGVILQLTRPLDTEADLSAIFRLAYAFALVIGFGAPLGLIMLSRPFLLSDPIHDCAKTTTAKPECEASARALHRRAAALAILPGCDFPTRDVKVTQEVDKRCGLLPPQWVVSLGGNILQCHVEGNCEEALKKSEEEGASAERDLRSATDELAATDRKLEELGRQSAPAAAAASGSVAELQKRHTELGAKVDSLKATIESERELAPKPITGGLVIPIYFVVLTLLGALVSMVRRLPEFQHRSLLSYPAEYAALVADPKAEPRPPLSFGQARDYVVFQMIQVASAPVIGVVAYAWAKPQEIPATTLLAFAAGFSSDVFLLAIRSIAERIVKPDLPRVVTASDSTPGKKPGDKAGPGAAFAVGDRVHLMQPVDTYLPGDSGKVIAVDAKGVTVQIEHAAVGEAPSLLEPQDASIFARDGAPPANGEGPVG